MDGLRPVSRAMDGATEPASKHITRATLHPEPTNHATIRGWKKSA